MCIIAKNSILVAILLALFFASTCFAKGTKQPDPYALATDLSLLLSYKGKQLSGNPIAIEKLDNNFANSIIRKKHQTENITWLPNKESEKKFLPTHSDVIVRTGKTLSIKTKLGPPIKFTNQYKPEGKGYEGDSTEYLYAGTLNATGYHMVGADYMHDSPSMYFINPSNCSILYVQLDHTVFVSNNRLLVINNSSNPPSGLVVAAITESGHKVELRCLGRNTRSDTFSSKFLGWHNQAEIGFDLAISKEIFGKSTNQKEPPLPVQFKFISGQWHIYAPKSKSFDLTSNLSCWQ